MRNVIQIFVCAIFILMAIGVEKNFAQEMPVFVRDEIARHGENNLYGWGTFSYALKDYYSAYVIQEGQSMKVWRDQPYVVTVVGIENSEKAYVTVVNSDNLDTSNVHEVVEGNSYILNGLDIYVSNVSDHGKIVRLVIDPDTDLYWVAVEENGYLNFYLNIAVPRDYVDEIGILTDSKEIPWSAKLFFQHDKLLTWIVTSDEWYLGGEFVQDRRVILNQALEQLAIPKYIKSMDVSCYYTSTYMPGMVGRKLSAIEQENGFFSLLSWGTIDRPDDTQTTYWVLWVQEGGRLEIEKFWSEESEFLIRQGININDPAQVTQLTEHTDEFAPFVTSQIIDGQSRSESEKWIIREYLR